ncbi:MAG: sulfite exporter TauE/SafE family protein [Anaerolineaceae bacterium]|nr:sulfite exporter TauE/SafE family protein [Anaerolineaceae bacterium]
MVNIILAFITGITTGGLSCLAVQGGLLASSLASQIEKDFQNAAPRRGKKKKETINRTQNRAKLAKPILAFLLAKMLAYTLLGFLLGLVGQMFQLSPYARAGLQIAIGIFMLGSALRMLNVHPIFRYFAFEPPAFLRRKLRNTAAAEAEESSLATPIFLGFLTVLIPCGITQAMMAVALGTANPVEGAAMMFAFTLGTSPVFFAVTYFATQMGKKLEKHFMHFVAVVVLVLAVITINSGLTLAGSPYSLTRMLSSVFSPPEEVSASIQPQGELQSYVPPGASSNLQGTSDPSSSLPADGTVVTVLVKNSGYQPDLVHAKAGVPVQLRLVSKNVRSCSRAFIIPSLGIQQILQATGEAVIEIPAQQAGAQIPFSCSMGMYGGMIVFDL